MKECFKQFTAFLLMLAVLLCGFPSSDFLSSAISLEGCASVYSDDVLEIPKNYGINLLSGIEPSSITVSTEPYGNIEKSIGNASVGTITDGTIDKSWLAPGALFADYNGGDVVCYENGEYCCDVEFMLKSYTDISKICVIHHKNRQIVTGRYQIYVSVSSSTLFYGCNLVADVDNSESLYRQIISIDSSKIDSCRFVGIRFINPISNKYGTNLLKVTATSNNYYPRLSEISVYGTESASPKYTSLEVSGSSKTKVTNKLDSSVALDLKKSLLYGKKETVTCVKAGKSSVGTSSSNNLTDGSAATSWYCSTLKFAEIVNYKVVFHRDQEDYYENITLGMDSVSNIGLIYIKNHSDPLLGLGHYQLYASDNVSSLYSEANKIADYYNAYHYTDQYFTPELGKTISGKYIGIRVYDPCCEYYNKWMSGANAASSAYPRINEIAVFPEESAADLVKFSNYRISGNAIGPIKSGTIAAGFYRYYMGDGAVDVSDRNGMLVSPSSEVEAGANVVVTGVLGKVKKMQIAVAGDNNSDSLITVTDIVKSIDLSINGGSGVGYLAADVNCDGNITVLDISKQRSMIINGVDKITDTTALPVKMDMCGSDTAGGRSVSVDLKNVITSEFHSFGTNSFPSTLSKTGMLASGYNSVYNELNAKRLVSVAESISRMWFQVDWMITNTETDTSAGNNANNKDYLNYINGVYDFNSEYMNALYQYIEMLDVAGTEVEINFGWKTSQRIESWFNAPTTNFKVGAPKNLPAFGRAAAALINQLVNVKGYKNVKYITYYNEPNAGDFQLTESEEKAYWSQLIIEADKAFKNAGVRKLVEFWGAEVAALDSDNTKNWMEYQLQNSSSVIDTWCGHHYYGVKYSNNYENIFNNLAYYSEKFSRNMVVTEMYGGGYHATGTRWASWDDSTTGFFIAVSNSGTRGMFSWSTVGGYLPEPLYMKLYENDGCAWVTPVNETMANSVNHVYYEQSLISNYIPNNSKVLYTNWIGKDIKASTYLLYDGNITVLVESNGYNSASRYIPESYNPKDIIIKFSDKINKTFYRFSYKPGNQVIDANCTVNPCDKVLSSSDGIMSDNYDGNYGVYIYTTKQPIKQISLERVQSHITAGGTLNITPKLIDCDENEEIAYRVTAYTGDYSGTVSTSGTYRASAAAKSGDMVAVRAYLKDNPKVFAVAVIYID